MIDEPQYDRNGWTASRLNDLAVRVRGVELAMVAMQSIVGDIQEMKKTLKQMQSDEITMLRDQLKETQNRPRMMMLAIGGPVVAVAIGEVLQHVFG